MIGMLLFAVACAGGSAATHTIVPILRPDGSTALLVGIFHHTLPSHDGPRQATTWVTHGLVRARQAELVLTLDLGGAKPSAAMNEDISNFFFTVNELALDGRRVGPGGVTRFGKPMKLGAATLHGVLYVPVRRMRDVPVPATALQVIPLLAPELDAVEQHGPLRVLGRLGLRSHAYPWPLWSELRRAPVVDDAMLRSTILNKSSRLHVPWVTVLQTTDRLLIRVARARPTEEGMELARDVVPHDVIALLTGFDPTTDHQLVWVPGEAKPHAIAEAGAPTRERRGGAFLVIIASEEDRDRIATLEDGFALGLTVDEARSVRGAIAYGKPLTLAAAGKRPAVEVEIVDRADGP